MELAIPNVPSGYGADQRNLRLLLVPSVAEAVYVAMTAPPSVRSYDELLAYPLAVVLFCMKSVDPSAETVWQTLQVPPVPGMAMFGAVAPGWMASTAPFAAPARRELYEP